MVAVAKGCGQSVVGPRKRFELSAELCRMGITLCLGPQNGHKQDGSFGPKWGDIILGALESWNRVSNLFC